MDTEDTGVHITDHICKNKTVTIRVQYSANFGDMRNSYRILVGKAERKRKFGRLLSRWRIILNVYLEERCCEANKFTIKRSLESIA